MSFMNAKMAFTEGNRSDEKKADQGRLPKTRLVLTASMHV